MAEAAVLEPQVARSPKPPKPAKPDRRWSPTRFAERWAAAKERQPGLKTRHLAAECEVDPATIRNWRRGVGKPDADQWMALAAVLGCDVFDMTEPNK